MAKQIINIGSVANDKSGDPLRTAFSKVNANFDELYAKDAGDVVLSAINASLIPDTDVAYDLGSATNRFRTLYLSGNTIDLGGALISAAADGTVSVPGVSVLYYVPDSIEDYGLTNPPVDWDELSNGTYVPAFYPDTPVIIDQITYFLAYYGSFSNEAQVGSLAAREGYVPTVYTPTMVLGENGYTIASIAITTPGSYDPSKAATVGIEILNTDNMWALPRDTDINNWDALVAAIADVESYAGPISAGVNMVATTSVAVGLNDYALASSIPADISDLTDTGNLLSSGPTSSLVGVLDQDVNVTVNSVPTVTATTTAGAGGPFTGQFEISEPFDILEVQTGWEMNTGTEQSPIWITVTNANLEPGEYWIYLASGFEFEFAPSTAYTFRSPTQVQQTWTFGTDGSLTLPGELHGTPDVGGTTINITPATDANDKKFGFRIDQINEPFSRAFLDMPSAENDKAVSISFNHTNNTTGYIFNQGTDTSDTRLNNAFNIFYNSGDIKLSAQGAGSVIHTWKFANDGNLHYPDGSFGSTAFVGDATRLYSNVDTDINVTVQHRPTVSAQCYIAVSDEFVADIEFNDDITVVQVGWTVDVGGTDYAVTSIDLAPPANQYRITAAGATFVQGTTYTFTNPNATVQSWTFNNTGELTTPGLGTISHQNNDLKLEVSGTDVIVLRTGGGDTVVTSDGDLQLGGNIITQGIVELTNIGAVTAYTPGIDMFVALQGFINNGVALRATDSQLISKDWLFSTDGNLTVPGGISSTDHLNLDADYDTGYSVYIGTNHSTPGMLGGVVIGDTRGGFVDIITEKLLITNTAVPAHSTGAEGDLAGQVAFDNTHIYYCIANYNQLGHQVTIAADYLGRTSLNTNLFQLAKTADTLQISVTDIISDSDGGATSIVVTVTSDENYTYVGTGGSAYSATFPLTFTSTDYVAGGNIWKRVAWSGDTW